MLVSAVRKRLAREAFRRISRRLARRELLVFCPLDVRT
jgi:hypothetical protein